MSAQAPPRILAAREAGTPMRSLWLCATPAATLLAAGIAPHLPTSLGVAAAITFGGGVLASIVPIALAAQSTLPTRAAVALGLSALAILVAMAIVGPRGVATVALVNTGLVAFAHAAGGGIGRHVQHEGHLLPACVVAAAADIASVVHPSGPTHAVVRSERALSVLALSFPVPGTRALAPVIGFGDLMFLALVFGAVVVHGLPLLRTALLAAVGLALAGALSAWLATGVPAIVPIAAALCLGIPAVRRVRPEDRKTTRIAITVAIAVVLGVLLERWLT